MVYSGKFTLEIKIKHRTENKPYIGRTLFDINCSKIFFDPPPRVMKIKTKINMHKLPAAAPACHYPVRGATARWPRSAVFSCLELYEFSFDSFDSFIVLCTAIKIKPKSYKSTDAVSRIS